MGGCETIEERFANCEAKISNMGSIMVQVFFSSLPRRKKKKCLLCCGTAEHFPKDKLSVDREVRAVRAGSITLSSQV